MKKLMSVAVVMLLCLSLVLPVCAVEAGNGFVPSITYKPTPEFVPVYDEAGNEYIGVIKDAEGNILDYVSHGCLLVTPIAHVWDEDIEVPIEVEELLLFLYNGLNDGSITIPYELHEANLDPANMVIRDLFDVRWNCEEHAKSLDEPGVVLELILDLGVVPEAQIYGQTYDEDTGTWEPLVSVVNNGDGTLTCIFEHLCGVEFSMPLTLTPAVVEEQKAPNILPWVIILVLAAIGIVAVVVSKKKKAAA